MSVNIRALPLLGALASCDGSSSALAPPPNQDALLDAIWRDIGEGNESLRASGGIVEHDNDVHVRNVECKSVAVKKLRAAAICNFEIVWLPSASPDGVPDRYWERKSALMYKTDGRWKISNY